MTCRFCDCSPCMCGRKDYPNTVCRKCGYSPCHCGFKDYEDKQQDDYDPDFAPYTEGP